MNKNKIEQILKIDNEWHTAYWNRNKMQQVAAIFNKKLGEVFSVEYPERNRNFASCCYFKADGLFCEDRGPCEIMLNDLLTGKAVIISE